MDKYEIVNELISKVGKDKAIYYLVTALSGDEIEEACEYIENTYLNGIGD